MAGKKPGSEDINAEPIGTGYTGIGGRQLRKKAHTKHGSPKRGQDDQPYPRGNSGRHGVREVRSTANPGNAGGGRDLNATDASAVKTKKKKWRLSHLKHPSDRNSSKQLTEGVGDCTRSESGVFARGGCRCIRRLKSLRKSGKYWSRTPSQTGRPGRDLKAELAVTQVPKAETNGEVKNERGE